MIPLQTTTTDKQNETSGEQQPGSSPNQSNNGDPRPTFLLCGSSCITTNRGMYFKRGRTLVDPARRILPKLRPEYVSTTEIAGDWYGLGSSAVAPCGDLMLLRQRDNSKKFKEQWTEKDRGRIPKMRKVAMCVALHIFRMRGTLDLDDALLREFLVRHRFPESETVAAANDLTSMVRDHVPNTTQPCEEFSPVGACILC